MKTSGQSLRKLAGFISFALISFLAACGGGGTDGTPPPGAGAGATIPTGPGAGGGVGGAGHGPIPVSMGTSGNFAVLAETAITNIPDSVITGNVGLSPALGTELGLTCAQVDGVIYTPTSAGTFGGRCRTVNAALLDQAVADGHAAWNDARVRAPDYVDVGGGNIGGMVLPPATYKWSAGVQIPSSVTLEGTQNDVWIFLIETDLIVSPNVEVILSGGALPQNIYWVTLVNHVEIGAGAHFRGIILAETFIDMRAGAAIDGRLLAAQAINLEQNVVTQP